MDEIIGEVEIDRDPETLGQAKPSVEHAEQQRTTVRRDGWLVERCQDRPIRKTLEENGLSGRLAQANGFLFS